MEEIQNLKKRTNFPPITLAELNDYTEGNKDKYINQLTYHDSNNNSNVPDFWWNNYNNNSINNPRF